MTKIKFFYKELAQYDLEQYQADQIIEAMLEGLEIMTKKEITQSIEDHLWAMGLR